MIIDLTKNSIIDEIYSFKDLGNSGILKLDNINIKGELVNSNLNLNIKGIAVLPCAVSLKPVNYPFEIEYSEEIDANLENTIDILPIIWENILAEIPIRVVSDDLSDVETSGDGWQIIDELGVKKNPELEKLKNLL